MNTPIRYVADVSHVREVALLGTADLAFWKERLQKEGLTPAERNDKAQILVTAADMKFMAVRFTELSFSVLVAPHRSGPPQGGAYLVRAFNSCRFFAFCERALFSTPYDHGDVQVSTALPASIQLRKGGEVLFRADMPPGASTAESGPSRDGEDGWEGPVFLPSKPRDKDRPGKLFFATIRGHTRAYPFLPSTSSLTIRPSPASEVFAALLESGFIGEEWAIREDARHRKSKTYKRSEVFDEPAPG